MLKRTLIQKTPLCCAKGFLNHLATGVADLFRTATPTDFYLSVTKIYETVR